MKRVAVILSGCGVMDGSEIHESVLSLLYLSQKGATYQCLAPTLLTTTVNHLTSEPTGEKRSALEEAARIARRDIQALETANPAEYDAVIIPGGLGAAKYLCDFAEKGKELTVLPALEQFIKGLQQARKAAGFICIAPMMIPKLYPHGVRMTIGNDKSTAEAAEALGATHIMCDVADVVIDDHHRVVSTPAYMLAETIAQAAQGIEKLVEHLLAF